MANDKDLEIWKRRWQALDATIDELQPSQPPFDDLVRDLKDFAQGQFMFFYEGFAKRATFELTPDKVDFPCEHVFRVIIDQISSDLDIIQDSLSLDCKSGAQESPSDGKPANYLEAALKTAEQLAQSALKPVEQHLFLEWQPDKAPTFKCFFEKRPSIRVNPYTPEVALISVPFTAINVPQDYLVIPHEVGHYVYWRGQVKGDGENQEKEVPTQFIYEVFNTSTVDQILQEHGGIDPQVRECVSAWTEEIFADVYGCLVGGPVIALSSQDLALTNSVQGFAEDDGEHPVPFLRPFIYTKVLEKMKFGALTKALRSRWTAKLGARQDDADYEAPSYLGQFRSKRSRESISRSAAREAVNVVIESILQCLEYPDSDGREPGGQETSLSSEKRPSSGETLAEEWRKWHDNEHNCWWDPRWEPPEPSQPVEPLYNKLEEMLGGTPGYAEETPPKPRPDGLALPDLWKDWARDKMKIKYLEITGVGRSVTKLPNGRISARRHHEEQEQKGRPYLVPEETAEPSGETWIPVLLAGGWTTKIGNHGPGG